MQANPGEFEIIRDYFARAPRGPGVVLGIGDDCALLSAPAEGLLATSVDTLVEGVHFPRQAPPELVAERALRVNLSDLAAMNARPLWFTLALTLPRSDAAWLQGFAAGLLETAAEFDISLVGGDTTAGPLSITVQVTGSAQQPLRRDGAAPGDDIFVGGPLGAAAAALPVILGQRRVSEAESHQVCDAYYRPAPQLALATIVGDLAHSAIDISDGLLADLGHLCRASGVGAELALETLPVAGLARRLAGEEALALAAAGGDDYQLCFTLPKSRTEELYRRCAAAGFEPVHIGRVTERRGDGEPVRCRLQGRPWHCKQSGYRHFQ
ncbi:thiamine-phosphate kinase [Microbulbifer discodermiae]|uniref:thiamine-phosphate kinase n=1 Tax=Microbulbifer sp. 2201CG32-9 TaxID=3232309 RepID=UPI00345BE19F